MRVCSLPLLLLFAGVAIADDRPTPKYEGKPLDYWVAKLENPADNKERDLATNALEAFGKDAAPAIPKLLVMLEDKSSEYRIRVQWIFTAMKDAAKPAVPTLVKRLEEGKCADPRGAMEILGSIGPEAKAAVPVLAKLIESKELAVPALCALCAIGPDAKDAVPAILAVLKSDPTENARLWSRTVELRGAVVPGLIELIENPSHGPGVDVIRTLGEIGPEAKAALPTLKKLMPSADELDVARKEGVFIGVDAGPIAEPERRNRERELRDRQTIAFAAASAVTKIEPCKEATEAVIVLVDRSHPYMVHSEVELLGRLGDPAALPVLKKELAALESGSNWASGYQKAIQAIEGKKSK